MVIVLIWFILGALNKVWPWKEIIETYIDRHGEIKPLIEKSIIPNRSNEVLVWIILCFTWFGIVIAVDKLSKKLTKS